MVAALSDNFLAQEYHTQEETELQKIYSISFFCLHKSKKMVSGKRIAKLSRFNWRTVRSTGICISMKPVGG